MNEVLANRANELLGGKKGEYVLIHPLDHVNMHQSTNDVYPTALKCAAISALRVLSDTAALLQGALQRKEKEFAHIIKIGRTELQDAVPMTLGAEFSAWAEAVSRDRWRAFKCEERLRVVNLGGTAIGTGLGSPRDYIFLVIERLRDISGLGLARGENIPGETANADAYVEVSGILKAHAVNLIKISNDLRLLNFLGEVRLPVCQAGSSIMPGKVNPVIPEAVIQAALRVMANDLLATEAASRSSLQINEFLPLLAQALLGSIGLLTAANKVLAAHIDGIQADEARAGLHLTQEAAGRGGATAGSRLPDIVGARLVQFPLGVAQLAIEGVKIITLFRVKEIRMIASEAADELDNARRQRRGGVAGHSQRQAEQHGQRRGD